MSLAGVWKFKGSRSFQYRTLSGEHSINLFKFPHRFSLGGICFTRTFSTASDIQKSHRNKPKWRSELVHVAENLEIKKADDWYQYTITDVESAGASAELLGHYKRSLIKMLKENFPEHNWKFYK